MSSHGVRVLPEAWSLGEQHAADAAFYTDARKDVPRTSSPHDTGSPITPHRAPAAPTGGSLFNSIPIAIADAGTPTYGRIDERTLDLEPFPRPQTHRSTWRHFDHLSGQMRMKLRYRWALWAYAFGLACGVGLGWVLRAL